MPVINIDKYDSKTGKGTLSYYARQSGTSVSELARRNNISNPDLIQEGAPLILPESGPLQSTKAYRGQTQKNMSKFDQDLARIKSEALSLKEKIDANAAKETEDKLNKTKVGVEEEDPYEGLDDKTRTLTQENEKTVKRIWDNYDQVSVYADQAHKALINSTKQMYKARIDRTRDSNKRLLATKNVSNIRQGRSRYTPELAQGALSDEEMQGEDRLTEIQTELVLALAEAEKARGREKMDMFNAAYDRADKAYTKLNEQIESNYKMAVEQEKIIREKEKAERDAKKQDFDMMTKRAEASAPGLLEQMKNFTSPEERKQFIEAYAERTGLDPDILMGELSTAADDKTYKELQISNIENQILNRDRSQSLAQAREARLATQKDEEEDEVSNLTNNILSGLSSYQDIEDPKERETAKFELSQYGLFETEPPQWFIEEYESQAMGAGDTQGNPKEIQSAWTEYRKARGII